MTFEIKKTAKKSTVQVHQVEIVSNWVKYLNYSYIHEQTVRVRSLVCFASVIYRQLVNYFFYLPPWGP